MTESTTPDIIFTKVDEAPQIASVSLLPIVRSFAAAAGVSIGTKDISLAGRIIATFPENLTAEQRQEDDLAALGQLVKTAEANVIKLPNISASVPQLVAAVKELQAQGYDIPDYPENPASDAEKQVRAKFDTIKGSAVNPVLREGNSDRRAARAVKKYAMANPHSMGAWSASSKTSVASMSIGDFRSNERSVTLSAAQAGPARIELVCANGNVQVLKDGLDFPEGTIVDATFMSAKALRQFLDGQIEATKKDGVLFSLHLKATMMKVSDPIIFGHAVKAYLQPVFDRFGDVLQAAAINPNSGIGAMIEDIQSLPEKDQIEAAIADVLADRPPLYMVNSDKGISNLHVPSDVIIDASMPALIRAGGKGWGPDGAEADANCVIPDEEYGSHPTTFEIPEEGTVRMVFANGDVLHEQLVEKGDIWRSASTRKAPIEDWVKLAIDRQKAENCQAVFWLDEARAHDAELIAYVRPLLAAAGVSDKFVIMAPRAATRASFETIRDGRKSNRFISDLRAGHICQNAFDRKADEWRRLVRNRSRGLGPQTRAAIDGRKPFTLGFLGGVLRHWRKL